MPEFCPSCGKDFTCPFCGYSEPPNVFRVSHHDFETECALVDNAREKMPEILVRLERGRELGYKYERIGAFVYKLTKPSPNAPSGRVIRIFSAIFKARGNTFARPKHYTERRASDRRSLKGYYSAHRKTPPRKKK